MPRAAVARQSLEGIAGGRTPAWNLLARGCPRLGGSPRLPVLESIKYKGVVPPSHRRFARWMLLSWRCSAWWPHGWPRRTRPSPSAIWHPMRSLRCPRGRWQSRGLLWERQADHGWVAQAEQRLVYGALVHHLRRRRVHGGMPTWSGPTWHLIAGGCQLWALYTSSSTGRWTRRCWYWVQRADPLRRGRRDARYGLRRWGCWPPLGQWS